MLKIAICDDEQIFIDDVTAKLKSQNEEYEISEYISGEELLNSSVVPCLYYTIILLVLQLCGVAISLS